MFLKFIQPSVEVFNLRIDEPITTLTDLILAGICFYAYKRIGRSEAGGRLKRYFRFYFLTLGLGALFGGLLGHAFLYSLGPGWKVVSWILILASVAILAHALIVLSRPHLKPGFNMIVAFFNLLVLSLALINTLITTGFTAVRYYTIFGMVVIVGSLSFLIYHRTGSRGMVRLMAAIGVGGISALVFSYELGLGPWLNHNDISHLILSYSAVTLYKGSQMIVESHSGVF